MIDYLVEEGSEIYALLPNSLDEMFFLYAGSIKVYVIAFALLTPLSVAITCICNFRFLLLR